MIRAGTADSPERSRYTSVWHRIQAALEANGTPWVGGPDDDPSGPASDEVQQTVDESPVAAGSTDLPADDRAELSDRLVPVGVRRDAWLAPVYEGGEPGNYGAPDYRASDKGYLPMQFEQFLELLDWSGRQLRWVWNSNRPMRGGPLREWGFWVVAFGRPTSN